MFERDLEPVVPAKAGTQRLEAGRKEGHWAPAFAGATKDLGTRVLLVLFWSFLAALLLLQLGGCASAAAQRPEFEAAVRPALPAPPQPTPGAIYADAGGGLALFQDQKARNVGDTLTVLLIERTTATSNASTSTTKDASVSLASPELFGRPVTLHGTPLFGASVSGEREFAGSGDTNQSNRLDGSITVRVVERLANGNLVIAGEKRLALNQSDEYVRVQGIVRPADIGPDNTVPSNRVGDARIEYSGDGALADANAMGWLTRVFQSDWWPF